MSTARYSDTWCRQKALRLVQTGEWKTTIPPNRRCTHKMRYHRPADEVIPQRLRGPKCNPEVRWYVLGSCHYSSASCYRLLCNNGKLIYSQGQLLSLEVRGLPAEMMAWNLGTIPNLAKQIRRTNCPDLLPLLADALEDAGCIDDNLINRLRCSEDNRAWVPALNRIFAGGIKTDRPQRFFVDQASDRTISSDGDTHTTVHFYVMDQKQVNHCQQLGWSLAPCVKCYTGRTPKTMELARQRAEAMVQRLNEENKNGT